MDIALGYEDLNDHEQLRHDPVLALMVGRDDITGQDRVEDRARGVPLAGKSTLNRLELTPAGAGKHSRYKKTVASVTKLQNTLVDTFIRMRSKQPLRLTRGREAKRPGAAIPAFRPRVKRSGVERRKPLMLMGLWSVLRGVRNVS